MKLTFRYVIHQSTPSFIILLIKVQLCTELSVYQNDINENNFLITVTQVDIQLLLRGFLLKGPHKNCHCIPPWFFLPSFAKMAALWVYETFNCVSFQTQYDLIAVGNTVKKHLAMTPEQDLLILFFSIHISPHL